jgi:leucyl-tRNA synthetase
MHDFTLQLPDEFDAPRVEAELAAAWERDRVYAWDATRPRSETFVVDTPPPTVSGSLHVGHVFSFTQTDVIVRYQRMRGRNIYYPMGWDDKVCPPSAACSASSTCALIRARRGPRSRSRRPKSVLDRRAASRGRRSSSCAIA